MQRLRHESFARMVLWESDSAILQGYLQAQLFKCDKTLKLCISINWNFESEWILYEWETKTKPQPN